MCVWYLETTWPNRALNVPSQTERAVAEHLMTGGR